MVVNGHAQARLSKPMVEAGYAKWEACTIVYALGNTPIIDLMERSYEGGAIVIQYSNMTLNYWGGNTLSRMSSLLGVPLYADECTTRQLRISFARILVEVDITRPCFKKFLWGSFW
ncbi:Bifunctional polymyxin resistance protein ArnA [Bienertia sinuspersici]